MEPSLFSCSRTAERLRYLQLFSNFMSATSPLAYLVAMPQPHTHLFEVTARVDNWSAPTLDLKMPVWTPGSYLVREYARHIAVLTATGNDGQDLSAIKVSKNHWQIATEGHQQVKVQYQVFANELTVRTNHLDATHGYFNPAALFFYIPGLEQQPIEIAIDPPAGWQVTTPLPHSQPNIFIADNFDTLVDSPFEIGQHQVHEFRAGEKTHQLAIWGEGNLDIARVIPDIQKIVDTTAQIFGGLPYDRYLFLLHLSANSYGGLEHKNCCSLLYPRWELRSDKDYQRFIQLVAHEFFHLWNVKRIFPKGLEKFDYDGENYTPSLWFSEGVTSYYDLLVPCRADIYDRATFLKELSKEISRYLTTPGRWVQPVTESSFDAWIKLYRQDANSSNSQMSYYLKGAMVTLLLDLLIRDRSKNQCSFDDVLNKLWLDYGQTARGFTAIALEALIQEVAGVDLQEFYQNYLYGLTELPFNDYLRPFGLEVIAADPNPLPPYWGAVVKNENSRALIKTVASGSPAAAVGINPGDELLAIDGYKISAEQLNERLFNYQPGDTIQITVFQQDQLCTYAVQLAPAQPNKYELAMLPQVTPQQLYNLQLWAGV
jgi:predicted metalloprotease with PDZ domain